MPEPNRIPPETALANLAAAAAQYRGTLAEHQTLQESIGVLSAVLKPAPQEAGGPAAPPAA